MKKTIYPAVLAAALFSTAAINAQETLSLETAPTGRIISKATKQMTSTLTANSFYTAGTTMDVSFTLTVTNQDSEYGDFFSMEFPAGFVINSAPDSIAVVTDPSNTFGGETLNLPIASPMVTWGDNDNSFGGIEPGAHTFTLNITIPASANGAININWNLSGDEFGSAPGDASGVTQLDPMPAGPDLVVVGYANTLYSQIPVSQAGTIDAVALVGNFGADLTVAHNLTTEYIGTSFTDVQSLSNPLVSNAIDTLPVIGGGFTTVGVHEIAFDVTLSNDLDPSDNTYSAFVNVTDSAMSYADTITGGGTVGFGAGLEGIVGNLFIVNTADDLTSVSMYSSNVNPNAEVTMVVYDLDLTTGLPNNVLWESDVFTTAGSGAGTFTQMIDEPIALNAGDIVYIGVKELAATDNMAIGYNLDAYQPGIGLGLYEGTWYDMADLGIPALVSVTANFGELAPNKVNDIAVSNFNVFPNPSTGVINLNGVEGNVTVMSVDGKIVKTATVNSANQTLDLSDLNNGIYLLQVTNQDSTNISKVTLKK